MHIKTTIVAYGFLVQCFENATIVAYAGLRVNTVCYSYLRTNFRGFHRFLIHGNLCCFIIYTMFKV